MPETEISKAEILDIALSEFLKSGTQSFTIQELTDLTGISSKTVYKLFGDKMGLLKACLEKHYGEMMVDLRLLGEAATDEVEALFGLLNRVSQLEFEINPKFYSDLNKFYPQLQDDLKNTLRGIEQFFLDTIESGKQQGFFVSTINNEVSFIAMQHLYSGITRGQIYRGLGLPNQKLIANTSMIYLRGMCSAKGLERLEQLNPTL